MSATVETGARGSSVPTIPMRRSHPLDPPDDMARLRATAPVSPLRFTDGSVGWLVTGYAAARRLLADTRLSSRMDLRRTTVRPSDGDDPPADPGMFIFQDPPDHTRYRRLLTGQFTVRRMRSLEGRVARIVAETLDAMEEAGSPADLVSGFAQPIGSTVICELLGVPVTDADFFRGWTTELFRVDTGEQQLIAAAEKIEDYLADLVRAKHSHLGDDILSGLIANAGLGDAEVAAMAMLLLTAGHDTTANMLGLGAFALLRHPGQLRRLRADASLVDNAVEELLRYLSIAQYDVANRCALADVEVEGTLIRAGQPVAIALNAANRDPAKFDGPDVLDITRATAGHLAFGHGVHQCLGQQLARIELRIGFAALLRRFGGLRLDVDASEVLMREGSTIYGVVSLPVSW
ncbi:MAG TPA: cytochrome P450 [Stackebrandtia sp.]|jgi:cytochrome P450|uniref:cytochrome P450 n=1 Tax=Stackebrandtia sp. TaxID=2023065 RepID=UPI002D3F8E12|nr:cytochrome P450 [Stackebrandtia sp.]HZE38427.1 cytochrome P450 [Stackebrandtia sp.]